MNSLRTLLAAFLAGSMAIAFADPPSQDPDVHQSRGQIVVHPSYLYSSNLPLRVEGTMPSLGGAVEWLNTSPLGVNALRGKVVVIDFWTYTCINWRRSLPYVRAWAEKYKDKGLTVIGVHSPEFSFEKDVANVRKAAQVMNIEYPIAVDNNFEVWNAFGNQYWPALYFIDARGRIRYHKFGEGDYEQSERVIRQLLAESEFGEFDDALVTVNPRGAEASADLRSLKSPETYVGHARWENFSSPDGLSLDATRSYRIPKLLLNHWGLMGNWTVRSESAVLEEPHGRIAYRFHARDLHLVMGPSVRGTEVRFRVLIDGRPPGAAHGADIDGFGNGTLVDQRLYQLVHQSNPIYDHLFEIEFLEPGAEVFSFTFS